MVGVTKCISVREQIEFSKKLTKILKEITEILPMKYNKEDIVELIHTYYPHEWKSYEYKKDYYDLKDKHLIQYGKKIRHKMPNPRALLFRNPYFIKINSTEYIEKHKKNFNPSLYKNSLIELQKKRIPKIKNINDKIDKAKRKTQSVTPKYLFKLIGLYEQKRTSQKDRVYIINELMKYYNDKVIRFFFKINDTELNIQLRMIAFQHLQSFNYNPRLRRQKYMSVRTKNKKRKKYLKEVYPYETFTIPKNPNELEYRINNGKEQKIKCYDYFISHSSADSALVQILINHENKIGKNIFCDWINDADYLKRNLVCEATLRVIEKRLNQSDAIIFVKTINSISSSWCSYELNYFKDLGKPIYVIEGNRIKEGCFDIQVYSDEEYYKSNYKELVLIK